MSVHYALPRPYRRNRSTNRSQPRRSLRLVLVKHDGSRQACIQREVCKHTGIIRLHLPRILRHRGISIDAAVTDALAVAPGDVHHAFPQVGDVEQIFLLHVQSAI